MAGMDRRTGRLIPKAEAIRQGIETMLTTPRNAALPG